ncbi:unnamed protein product [Lymnaea stagnalis]|uniref:Sushi domain-containing protein n=1 Tax=Lymnaea stagnalis TaxID=6523 RepID=A0AAV2H7V8_LYMST
MTGDSNIMSLRAPPDIKHKHNCSPIMTHHIFDYEYTDDNTVKFECLLNHHYVSGELTSTCLDNGTWTNPSGIVCEVDYYMQRYRLAALIVAITVVFSAVFLGYDFITYRCHYVRLRKTYRARLYAQGPLAIFDFEKSRAKEVLTDRLPNRRFSRINKFTDSRGRLVSTYSLFADLSITTGGSSEASDSTKRTRDYYQPGSSAMPSLRRTVSAPYGWVFHFLK